MARAKGLLGILSLAPMVVFAASQATEVPLLGEEYVKDVNEYASRIGQEAKDLLRTPLEEWNFYGSYDRGLKVYWRPVKDNKLVIMRSYVEVPQSSAGLFELLSSAEGAKVLDDTTNHTDAPLEILHWQDRAEVSYSKTIPAKFPFGQRSFLKATFFDQEKRLLVSKSILRNDMPPGADGSTRAFNSFAIKTQDLEPGTCSLEVLDYFDMRGWFPVWIANKFHKDTFCQSMHKRLWQHLDSQTEAVKMPTSVMSVLKRS
ncbi:g4721 [Coccomyxa viridis]|uniref:G4721 protein n=1 Tax=Coccomyxa viridis TaxID=1274662 RepID=A0ABP1FW73_9CHLO